jgi:hypothetical protein
MCHVDTNLYKILISDNNVDWQCVKCVIRRCIKKFWDWFHRTPTDGSTWMCALWLGAGNVATQYAKWRHCVNIWSSTTPVFVTTYACTSTISAWTWNWSREQTSNSALNSENLERRFLKWYDVCMEMRPWVVQGVSSGTRALQEKQNITRRRRELRATFHKLNTQKCENNSAAYAWGSSQNH